MRAPHLVLAAFFAIAAFEVGASFPRRDLPVADIQSCLNELRRLSDLEGRSDSHEFDLYERCPALATALAQWMHEEDAGVIEVDATSIEGLRDLASYAAGFHRRAEAAGDIDLDFDGLDALLDEVLVEREIDDTLWDRFLRWLEQYAKDEESPRFRRFLDWLAELDAPPWLGDVIVNASVVLIVLLALIVVGNELRLSGLLRGMRRRREVTERVAGTEMSQKSRPMSLGELRRLPARQMAAAILETVTAAFAERGWLSFSSSLTNGELVKEIGQRQDAVAGSFAALVNGIESIIYGDRPADDETRQRLVDCAARLIEQAHGSTAPASRNAR